MIHIYVWIQVIVAVSRFCCPCWRLIAGHDRAGISLWNWCVSPVSDLYVFNLTDHLEPQLVDSDGITIDSIRTEYHPNSNRGIKVETFEDYREHTLKPNSVPEITDPWRPFQSRTDFEFAQLALDAALTKTHLDKLIQLVERCVKGQDSFNITNSQDLYNTWDAASTMLTPVLANTNTSHCYF